MRKLVWYLVGIVCIFHIIGCATPLTPEDINCLFISEFKINNSYLHPDFKEMKIHDIGIVKLRNDSQFKRRDISSEVTQVFIAELNKRGWYVIHEIRQEDLAYPERLGRIDAILTGSITDYREAEPLRLGIKLSLQDLNTKETIWSAQDIFDASQKRVVEGVRKYYSTRVSKSQPLLGYKLYLMSLTRFSEFCLNKVIDTLIIKEEKKAKEEAKKVAKEGLKEGKLEKKKELNSAEDPKTDAGIIKPAGKMRPRIGG